MVKRYSATSAMRQSPNGNFVETIEYHRLEELLQDVRQYAIDQMKAFRGGEITAEEAIASVACYARQIGINDDGGAQ